jgi:CubicO group peptidase (beta-lactamase class C family)
VAEFPRDGRDLSGIRIKNLTDEEMSFAEALEATYIDGFVVLHKGSILFEEYRGEEAPDLPHVCFSVTKSMAGMLAADLLAQGLLDENARVTKPFPICVTGIGCVGSVTVSGAPDREDHAMVVAVLSEMCSVTLADVMLN